MKIDHSGYGAGTREFPAMPTCCGSPWRSNCKRRPRRGCQPSPATFNDAWTETITVLEANLDDLSPQVLAYAMERLLAEGALDVFSIPVQMKKSRTARCSPCSRN